MAKVRILDGDDWKVLFVDGERKSNGHSIRIDDLLDALGVDYEIVYGEFDEDCRFHADSVYTNGRRPVADEAFKRIAAEVDGTLDTE
jgi:hypothetical protein